MCVTNPSASGFIAKTACGAWAVVSWPVGAVAGVLDPLLRSRSARARAPQRYVRRSAVGRRLSGALRGQHRRERLVDGLAFAERHLRLAVKAQGERLTIPEGR